MLDSIAQNTSGPGNRTFGLLSDAHTNLDQNIWTK